MTTKENPSMDLDYIDAAFQRVMEAEKMGPGFRATAVRVELGSVWEASARLLGGAVRPDIEHAWRFINEAIDKAGYGDSVESDLLEVHHALEAARAALAEGAPR